MIAKPALKTVLCVDELPQICNLIEAILTEHRILSVANVAEAMSMLETDSVFLIVIDCKMLDGAAAETDTAMKAKRPGVKVVLTSAGDQPEEIRALGGLVDGMVMKTGGDFVGELRRVVDELDE
jgi:DNA-binding NtrC family response regulator